MRMMHPVLVLLVGLLGLAVTACSATYPITTGSHVPGDPLAVGGPRQTYVVWPARVLDDDPGTLSYLASLLMASGHRVVERAQVQRLFDEQRFRLMRSGDAEADLLRVGQMAGATQVIFLAIQTDGVMESARMTVSLRSVDVQSGAVRWTGSASLWAGGNPFVYRELGAETARWLAAVALQRAVCATERGRRWVEPGPEAPGGACQ